MPVPRPAVGLLAGLFASSPAIAGNVDLAIQDVIVTQAVRYTNTPLVAENPTFIRVLVDTPGCACSVDGVDALVRVYVDGVETADSPLRSLNGPITTPDAPNSLAINDHLNFWFITPESGSVSFEVVLNPDLQVPENDTSNNVLSIAGTNVVCRRTVELVYVPIDYTPGGGEPDAALIAPGVGDGFVRAIFKPGEWAYHRSPLPPLVWNQNINDSNSALLTTLRDIRLNQIPAAGFPVPDFVYGWLPGNPFFGNGQAIGIPGDVAFGNTQLSRFQRTFAHEIGHLLDEPHNGENVGTIGVDVEHHLINTQLVPQLHDAGKLDIMVAGQVTTAAFVSQSTYTQANGDSRFFCGGSPMQAAGPALRVAGEFNTTTGAVTLDPIMPLAHTAFDHDHEGGSLFVVGRSDTGKELLRVRAVDRRVAHSCADPTHDHGSAPLHVVIPEQVGNQQVDRVDIVNAETGALLASTRRSANPPAVGIRGIETTAQVDPLETTELTTIRWTAVDPDGDELRFNVLYSPGNGRWLPVGVNLTGNSHTFDGSYLPAAADGTFAVVASDGFNHDRAQSPLMAFGANNRPEVAIITPDLGSSYPNGAPVILHATAFDAEDGVYLDEIVWASSIDGALGTGRLLARVLSPGSHTITASVTDLAGEKGQTQVFMSINQRDLMSADLDNDGIIGFNDLLGVLEAWGPCDDPDFCPADFDQSNTVNFDDLLFLLSSWGS